MRNVLALILTLGLLVSAPISAFAQEEDFLEEDPNTVCDEAQLKAWCEAHWQTGGTVYLGDTITIGTGFELYNGLYPPIVIDTKIHGIVYDGGSLGIGNWQLMGEGIETPVLVVNDSGSSFHAYFGYNEQFDVQRLFITAYGKDGIGGTAVRFNRADPYSINPSDLTTNGLIRAEGLGAVGVEMLQAMDLYCFTVEVEGENSVAVAAPDGSNLYYCKLSADEGGSVVSGDGIFFDTCRLSPAPDNDNFINRRILGTYGGSLYVPVKQHGESWNSPFCGYLLSGTESSPPHVMYFNVHWDPAVCFSIDTGVLGTSIVPGSLLAPFDGLGLEDNYSLDLLFDVRDPLRPCISELHFYEDDDGKWVKLFTWESHNPATDKVILWRSDDGGESWYDFTHNQSIEWHDSGVTFRYEQIPFTIMLLIQTPDGESNVVTLYETDGKGLGGSGGDRTGADRFPEFGGDTETGDNTSDPPDNGSGSNRPGGIIGGGTQTGSNNTGGNNTNDDTKTDGGSGGDDSGDDGVGNTTEQTPDTQLNTQTPPELEPEPEPEPESEPTVESEPTEESEPKSIVAVITLPTEPELQLEPELQPTLAANEEEAVLAADSQSAPEPIPAAVEEQASPAASDSKSISEATREADEKQAAPAAQPTVPQPSFPTGAAAAVIGGVLILTAGAAVWLRISKPGRVKNGKSSAKKSI